MVSRNSKYTVICPKNPKFDLEKPVLDQSQGAQESRQQAREAARENIAERKERGRDVIAEAENIRGILGGVNSVKVAKAAKHGTYHGRDLYDMRMDKSKPGTRDHACYKGDDVRVLTDLVKVPHKADYEAMRAKKARLLERQGFTLTTTGDYSSAPNTHKPDKRTRGHSNQSGPG